MKFIKITPATLVVVSFLFAVVVGAALLKLPFATVSGSISLIDALFTATSAVCVTGLVVVDTGGYFTTFGQCVILALIQVGGLGIMTISVSFFRWIGRTISFRQRMIMQDQFAHTPREDIFSLMRHILFFTVCAELIGAALLTLHWSRELPFSEAAYTAVFHSVSAFCNAGFSLYTNSMVDYSGSMLLNTTLCTLIIIGGIGFPVLYDLKLWMFRRHGKRIRLSIQTKVVLITSTVLVLGGALFFGLLEREQLGSTPTTLHKVFMPLFQSITCRTAGFNTVDVSSLHNATLVLFIFLMFCGASPGSCGGGIKTTTLALLAVFVYGRIRKQRRVTLFKRSVPEETVNRSITLLLLSTAVIAFFLFLLFLGDNVAGHPITGQRRTFLAYLFEAVSAFGTVGLSMGVTAQLTMWGKGLIILLMFIGRVGLITFTYVITFTTVDTLEYSEENMMVG